MIGLKARGAQASALTLLLLVLLVGCGSEEKSTQPESGSGSGTGAGGGGGGVYNAVRGSQMRAETRQHLKQIALAIHSFETENNGLPVVATRGSNGEQLLSWRVHLLTHLGQNNLYRQFRLNEPWDSEHNKKLIPMMPKKIYGDDQGGREGHTHYEVFANVDPNPRAQTPFTFADRPGTIRSGVRMASIANGDGAANTILVAEAKNAVPWTKPTYLPYGEQRPIVGVGGLYPTQPGFLAVFADGSVGHIPASAPTASVRNAITYNDGQPPGLGR